MSKIGYFHYVKNKIDEFRHLACIQQEIRKAVANDNSETTQIQKITEYPYFP